MSTYIITFEAYPGTEIKTFTAVCIGTGKDDAIKKLKKKVHHILGTISILSVKHIGEKDFIIGKSIQDMKKKSSEKSF